ncbi:DUF2089 domain-containing protein [Acholeplasma sp. OttesenSCG-928-E16]|nr:DUF2089 domain-containing protein [Acholeplasma sp. OttesenSCG-928-E16]
MKNHKVISKCPICNGDMEVKVLQCDHCNTKIEGSFRLSKFDYLTDAQLFFVELFLKNKGSIKAVEKDLNVSYPTVKKYLDDVIISLGYQIEDQVEEPINRDSLDVYDLLKNKLISLEEAVEILKKNK